MSTPSVKEALIYPSFPRRRESMVLSAKDARWRGHDGTRAVQRFLTTTLLLALAFLLAACAGQPTRHQAPGEIAADEAPQAPAVDAATREAFQQGLALLRQSDYHQAIAVLTPVSQANPQLPGVFVNLGLAYMQLDKEEDASAAFRQALATDPQHPAALNGIAILSRKAGRFKEARGYYERLVEAHPDYANGHYNLGILCDLYLHEPDCALRHYQRYQALAKEQDPRVGQWIADLERRNNRG